METKTAVVISVIASLVVGILIGRFAFGGGRAQEPRIVTLAHQMPDGTMMGNDSQPADMSSMMSNMNAALVGKTGDAFDQSFLSEMIVHHEGAVGMAKLVLANSKRPELISLANRIISAQNGEIAQMKAWQKQWFKP